VSGLAPVNDRLSQVDCAVPTIAPLGLAMEGRVPMRVENTIFGIQWDQSFLQNGVEKFLVRSFVHAARGKLPPKSGVQIY